MKRHYSSLVVACVVVTLQVQLAHQFESDNIGRAVREHLGTLYDLRSKLGGSASPSPTASPTYNGHHKGQKHQKGNELKKESRANGFYYASADVAHPKSASLAVLHTQDFQSRLGKVSESPSYANSNMWKRSDKVDKYSKLAYKGAKGSNVVNSFNVHLKSLDTNETTSDDIETTSLPSINPTSSTATNPPVLNLGPLKSFTQGFNSAVTQTLIQKLMNMMDQDAPPSFVHPFRHLVASGNRMIDFWDKRTVARDGKTPGIVEMLAHGLDQLKKFRDGHELRASDLVSASTPASEAFVQGMVVVKKLTNRVLGYNTDEAAMESRGGYGGGGDGWGGGGGGGGGGWGWGMSSGQYLDPYAILATLGFGTFLFNVIYNLLNNNQNNMMMMAAGGMGMGRSIHSSDVEVPSAALSDSLKTSGGSNEKIFGTPKARSKRNAKDGDESAFFSIVDKLDGVVKAYQKISEKPKCTKLYICRIAVQDALGDEKSILAKLYMLGLGHLSKDSSVNSFVKSIQKRVTAGEDVNCDKILRQCMN